MKHLSVYESFDSNSFVNVVKLFPNKEMLEYLKKFVLNADLLKESPTAWFMAPGHGYIEYEIELERGIHPGEKHVSLERYMDWRFEWNHLLNTDKSYRFLKVVASLIKPETKKPFLYPNVKNATPQEISDEYNVDLNCGNILKLILDPTYNPISWEKINTEPE